VLQSEWL